MEEREPDRSPGGAPLRRLLVVAALAFALVHVVLFAQRWRAGEVLAWGWDESMHSAQPAGLIGLNAAVGDLHGSLEALADCERYPPVVPLLVGGAYAIGARLHGYEGVPYEGLARSLLFGLWLLLGVGGAARLARATGRTMPTVGALAALFVLLSPLAARYAPTLYLEPFFVAAVLHALRYWCLGLRTEASRWTPWWAGASIALALFTKWNYGVLLIAGLGVSALVEGGLAAWNPGRARVLWRRAWRVLVPLLVALFWWFVLPLPLGFDVAASHRAEFWDYVRSNTELAGAPDYDRAFFWYCGVAAHPALLVLLVLGALRSLARLTDPAVRALWIVFVAFVVPCTTHHFFLDRFLLAPGVLLLVLAAVGWSEALSSSKLERVTGGALAAVAVALAVATPIFAWAKALPLPGTLRFPASDVERVADYQRSIIRDVRGLWGTPATNGLPRAVHEELLDLIAAGVSPTERVGWVGQSSEVSPAALHFGLLERGGSVERFLDDAGRPMDLTPVPSPPPEPFTPEQVRTWAEAFDALVFTAPLDLKARGARAGLRDAWQVPLLQGGWSETPLGTLAVPRDPAPPLEVEVRLARRE